MKEIQLTQGKVAIVDDEDFEWLSQWKWYARKSGRTFYAVRHKPIVDTLIMMHRVIMDAPDGIQVDHKNGDGLRNTRNNLRLCTQTENMRNRIMLSSNTSGYKGVSWSKDANKWNAQIKLNNKKIHLGYFNDQKNAAHAYDEAAKKYHGEFSSLNFPEQDE